VRSNPLFDDLRAAFPPKPIVIGEGLYCDAADYREHMDGRTWEQLDPLFFARRADGLSFLSASFLIQVLPLYLHLMIVFKPTSPVPETLLPMLTKPEKGHYWSDHLLDHVTRRYEALVASLSSAQKRVVAATLQLFVEEATPYAKAAAQRALDLYWHRFLDPETGR
jgi:hypothetical protein